MSRTIFDSQAEYEFYYSREQRAARTNQARQASELAVTEACALAGDGDTFGAQQRLADAGFDFDGIAYYLRTWDHKH